MNREIIVKVLDRHLPWLPEALERLADEIIAECEKLKPHYCICSVPCLHYEGYCYVGDCLKCGLPIAKEEKYCDCKEPDRNNIFCDICGKPLPQKDKVDKTEAGKVIQETIKVIQETNILLEKITKPEQKPKERIEELTRWYAPEGINCALIRTMDKLNQLIQAWNNQGQ